MVESALLKTGTVLGALAIRIGATFFSVLLHEVTYNYLSIYDACLPTCGAR